MKSKILMACVLVLCIGCDMGVGTSSGPVGVGDQSGLGGVIIGSDFTSQVGSYMIYVPSDVVITVDGNGKREKVTATLPDEHGEMMTIESQRGSVPACRTAQRTSGQISMHGTIQTVTPSSSGLCVAHTTNLMNWQPVPDLFTYFSGYFDLIAGDGQTPHTHIYELWHELAPIFVKITVKFFGDDPRFIPVDSAFDTMIGSFTGINLTNESAPTSDLSQANRPE